MLIFMRCCKSVITKRYFHIMFVRKRINLQFADSLPRRKWYPAWTERLLSREWKEELPKSESIIHSLDISNGAQKCSIVYFKLYALQWHHNEHSGVSNSWPYDCLLNRLFRRRWHKTSKLRVTGLCEGDSPAPAQRASNAENVSIWWLHHVLFPYTVISTRLVLIISTIKEIKCVLKIRCQHTKIFKLPNCHCYTVFNILMWCSQHCYDVNGVVLSENQGYIYSSKHSQPEPRLYGIPGICLMGEI